MTAPWRLAARPLPAPAAAGDPGWRPLGLGGARDGLLHVPAGEGPVPLVVLLHGAGSSAASVTPLLEDAGVAVLAPDSRGATWDLIRGGFGPDVTFIDLALAAAFAAAPVDPARLALAGFSDGASYALSVGLGNGDLFSHLLAFSPGFAAPEGQVGRPPVYVSHGVADPVLPIERCSRPLVARLRGAGYEVTYEEFDGGHVVPPHAVQAALGLLCA